MLRGALHQILKFSLHFKGNISLLHTWTSDDCPTHDSSLSLKRLWWSMGYSVLCSPLIHVLPASIFVLPDLYGDPLWHVIIASWTTAEGSWCPSFALISSSLCHISLWLLSHDGQKAFCSLPVCCYDSILTIDLGITLFYGFLHLVVWLIFLFNIFFCNMTLWLFYDSDNYNLS